MQLYKVRWTPGAKEHLWTIFDFLLTESGPKRAENIYSSLETAGESLAIFPLRGRSHHRGTLQLTLTKIPYNLTYKIFDETRTVWIIGVFHQKRNR